MKRFPLLPFVLAVAAHGLMGQSEPKVEGPVVLLVGPPESGKSTQAPAAARVLNLPVVGVDDLIKANQATFAELHRSGVTGMEPQTDPVLNRLFMERLQKGDLSHGMILDGYPSTKDHYDYLAGLVRKGVLSAPLIIELQIPDKVVLQRTKDAHRDSLGSVEQRLKDYHREMDLLQLYFPAAEVVHVDGTKSVNQVGDDIAAILKKRFGPRRGRRP